MRRRIFKAGHRLMWAAFSASGAKASACQIAGEFLLWLSFLSPVRAGGDKGHGLIERWEHVDAHRRYVEVNGDLQSAAQLAMDGGFRYDDLVLYLGHAPKTWRAWHPWRPRP